MPNSAGLKQRLNVVGVRYWDAAPTPGDNSALDAYRAAGAYDAGAATTHYAEVRDDGAPLEADPVARLGALCARIAVPIEAGLRAGGPLLVAGGCCSHAPGILGGMQRALGAQARIGVVWLDAHGDFNTPATTLSGGLYGMPLAVCAGLAHHCWREMAGMLVPIPTDRIVLADARNLDAPERQLLHATDVAITGFDNTFGAAVRALAARVDALYLHIDTDVLDPAYMPTVHLGEPGGPSLDALCKAVRVTFATGKVRAYTVASVRNFGVGREVSVASALRLMRVGLAGWGFEIRILK